MFLLPLRIPQHLDEHMAIYQQLCVIICSNEQVSEKTNFRRMSAQQISKPTTMFNNSCSNLYELSIYVYTMWLLFFRCRQKGSQFWSTIYRFKAISKNGKTEIEKKTLSLFPFSISNFNKLSKFRMRKKSISKYIQSATFANSSILTTELHRKIQCWGNTYTHKHEEKSKRRSFKN